MAQLLTTWLNWKKSSKSNHSEGHCRGGHTQQWQISVAWSRHVTHLPQRPRLAQIPPLLPVQRSPHYEGDVWQAIREATRGEPLVVWLLGGQDRQLSVDQLVLQDGRTYRTQGSHERLLETCAKLGNPELADKAFGENHAASIMAKEKNGLKPTPTSLLQDIQKACVEHGQGGLWNLMDYDARDVVSIDTKACYPASFQGMGEAKPYFERFGHPTHRMTQYNITIFTIFNKGTNKCDIHFLERFSTSMALSTKTLAWALPRSRNESLGQPVTLLSLPGSEGILQMPQAEVGPRRVPHNLAC